MTDFTEAEQQLYDDAMRLVRIKAFKRKVAKHYVDSFPQEESPVSVFMAGSPGAGKTEVSEKLIEELGGDVLRLDSDDLRHEFTGYTGINSYVFQDASTRLLESLHDRALKRSVSFILDSTLSSYDKAVSNIERSLNRGRSVLISFVYQEPQQAWAFVKAREKVEGRRVPMDIFIDKFLLSRQVVNALKKKFNNNVVLQVLVKNIDGSDKLFNSNVDSVDPYLGKKYNRASLEKIVELYEEGGNNASKTT